MDKDCYVDKPMLYWVIGIALTISASVIASSYNNHQKRIEESLTNRQQKTDECILKMKEDISEIKTDIKWLNEMRKNGEIVIKQQAFKVASTTKSQ